MLNLVPIVAPEGEPGMFHSDSILESYAISEMYGYVVFFVVSMLFLVVGGVVAKIYLALQEASLHGIIVGCYDKIKRMI